MSKEESNTDIMDFILNDEYIAHELLHVKYPDWSEDQVNKETERLLNQSKYEYNIRSKSKR